MGWLSDQFGISSATEAKILATVALLTAVVIARWLVLRAVQRSFEETWVAYRARKVATYIATIIGAGALAWIWVDAFNDLATFLGLLSAGVAIALADVLKNMVGWGYILSRRPFKVGDRIEIDGTKGDVVDIRLFRFSLMEVGNWVQAEQSTGRLIHVPNGLLFTSQVANYTEGFEYIWTEVPVLVSFESDWRRAREVIERALVVHAPNVEQSAGKRIRETALSYHIKIGALSPIVYLSVEDSGVLLTGRFLVAARDQRGIAQAVWEAILDGFHDDPSIELAYPTVRTFFHGPVHVAQEAEDPAPAD